jgi:hypothetical protein
MNYIINKSHFEKNNHSNVHFLRKVGSRRNIIPIHHRTCDDLFQVEPSKVIPFICSVLFYVFNSITEFLAANDFFSPDNPSPGLIILAFNFLVGGSTLYMLLFFHEKDTETISFILIIKIINFILVFLLLTSTLISVIYDIYILSCIGYYVSMAISILVFIALCIYLCFCINQSEEEGKDIQDSLDL